MTLRIKLRRRLGIDGVEKDSKKIKDDLKEAKDEIKDLDARLKELEKK